MKKLILSLVAVGANLWSLPTLAFVAYETSPGVIEVRGSRDQGLLVHRVQERRVRGKRWVYFCVSDRAMDVKVKKEKCFYGNPSDFKGLKVGSIYRSVEYGLRNRIYNSQGRIAIGAQKHFYPAYVLYRL